MSNFELIDDYLANRLSAEDKTAFESQLANDPTLKSDVELQQQIVEGIRKARVSELKTMLNNVPVPAGAGVSFEFTLTRIAASVLIAGAVSAAVYFYLRPEDFPPIGKAAADIEKQEQQQQPEKDASKNDTPEQTPAKQEDAVTPPVENKEKKQEVRKEKSATSQAPPAERPKIDVTDPSDELSSDEKANDEMPNTRAKSDISPAHVQVEMDSSNKKYDFHYQFTGSRLMLYGAFDKSLYEVLEINTDSHAIFLFYKDNFYLLDENQEQIKKLTPVKDEALLRKLREYRKR